MIIEVVFDLCVAGESVRWLMSLYQLLVAVFIHFLQAGECRTV